MSIRFFHTADLHLESPFKGSYELPNFITEELRQSTFKAFSTLVDYAIKERPDFLLIVGDVYDGENRSLSAQYHFQQQLERLNAVHIPVLISYGNHDHLSGSWTRLSLPSNVYEFTPHVDTHTLHIRGEKVHIHGFSYATRHIAEPMIQAYPTNQDSEIHIGMLHGSVDTDLEHAVYAPFTVQQLLEKNYHYWALGHIHKRQVLNEEPPVIYPGNIQGRHRKESGEKGFYDVVLQKEDTKLEFVETTVIRYMTYTIDCGEVRYATELLQLVEGELEQLRQTYGAIMLELILTNFTAEFTTIYLQSTDADWLQTFRDGQQGHEPFIWVMNMTANLKSESFKETTLTKELFETIEQFSQQQLFEMTGDLLNQPKFVKYTDRFSTEDWQLLQAEARQMLQRYLAVEVK